MSPATALGPNSPDGAEVVVEVDLELPGLGGQVTGQESHVLVSERQEGPPSPVGQECLGRRNPAG